MQALKATGGNPRLRLDSTKSLHKHIATLLGGVNYLVRRVASRRNVTGALVVVGPGLSSISIVVEGCGHVGEGGVGGQR